MANNWKIHTANAKYTCKSGIDANTGGKDDPFNTVGQRTFSIHVIGTGVYKQIFTLGTSSSRTYHADGYVKFIALGNVIANSDDNVYAIELNDIDIDLNGYDLDFNRQLQLNNCTIKNGQILQGGLLGAVLPSVMFCDIISTSVNLTDASCFGSLIDTNSSAILNRTYIAPSIVIDANAALTTFVNSNVQGAFLIGGNLYELKEKRDRSPIPNPNPSYLDYAILDAGVYDRGNFNEDPQYINLAKGDYFSVAPSSPMLFRVGTLPIAKCKANYVYSSLDAEYANATLDDALLVSNDFVFDTNSLDDDASILPQPLFFANTPTQMGVVRYIGAYTFDSDEPAGIENQNVPRIANPLVNSAEATPSRLTYEMMYSTSQNAPTALADYDNEGNVPAGTFLKFEWNTQPMVDVQGRGNGDPEFNPIGAAPIALTWFLPKTHLKRKSEII